MCHFERILEEEETCSNRNCRNLFDGVHDIRWFWHGENKAPLLFLFNFLIFLITIGYDLMKMLLWCSLIRYSHNLNVAKIGPTAVAESRAHPSNSEPSAYAKCDLCWLWSMIEFALIGCRSCLISTARFSVSPRHSSTLTRSFARWIMDRKRFPSSSYARRKVLKVFGTTAEIRADSMRFPWKIYLPIISKE